MNLFDYVKQYGSYTFDEEPFNDVDNVIFAQLSYLPLSGIVSGFGHRPVTLEKVAKIFDKKIKNKQKFLTARFCKKIYKLLMVMYTTNRYKNILLYNYIQEIDYDRQFGAVTLRLPNNTVYVSYEGTDSSISGWYEDARMTYAFPIPAQMLALKYLKRTVRLLDQKVILGGHSKGGNLAIYAALEAPFYIKNKIVKVYNNDGPGFFKEQIDTKKYQKLIPKISKIVPCESVVGMFLYQGEDTIIIKSKRKRILQHDSFNWLIDGNHFVSDNLSDFSRKVSIKTNDWLNHLGKDKRRECIENLFEAFNSSNIINTYHLLSFTKAKSFFKQLYHIDVESKNNLIAVFKEMIW